MAHLQDRFPNLHVINHPLIVDKLSEILEVRALAHQGLFYQSEDLEDLEDAIDAWGRYQEHATRHRRADLSRHAEEQLTRLEDVRERLQ